jgi:thymidylate synthase (FAD)
MEPKATLVNWTPKPIETMCWCRRVMHSPVPDSLDEFIKDSKKWLGMDMDEYVEKVLLHDNMPTFLEFVHMTFLFENVSRALTHQLVRTRLASYSQQSLRCIQLPNFADKELYHMPASVRNKKGFRDAMLKIQELYNGLLETESTEDARGVLPMNIGTTIIMGCNLRTLQDMVNKRLCIKTQEEFRKVAEQILQEVSSKMDKRLLKLFGRPCDINNKCLMESECEMQYQEGKRAGQQQTEFCCPIFVQKFKR